MLVVVVVGLWRRSGDFGGEGRGGGWLLLVFVGRGAFG